MKKEFEFFLTWTSIAPCVLSLKKKHLIFIGKKKKTGGSLGRTKVGAFVGEDGTGE